jgi:hypothetical protein
MFLTFCLEAAGQLPADKKLEFLGLFKAGLQPLFL